MDLKQWRRKASDVVATNGKWEISNWKITHLAPEALQAVLYSCKARSALR